MLGLSTLRPSTAEGKGLDGPSNPTQTRWGSLYGRSGATMPNLQSEIPWCNGATFCFDNIPGRLAGLDLQQPSDDLLAQGALAQSAERPDDLLPTMSSLIEESDVSGNLAFPVHRAVEGAESPLISFPGSTAAPFYQAESHMQLDSFSLDPLHQYCVTETAACHKDCAITWCDILDDIRLPLIPVAATPLQGWEAPLVAMGITGYPVHGQPEKASRSRFCGTLSPSSPCSANTSSQSGACLADTWARSRDFHCSPVELPQTPAAFLAPERAGSTGSNDISTIPYNTAAMAAPVDPYLSGTPRPCSDALITAPAAPRVACIPTTPARRRPAVRIRAGRSTLYPAPPTVPAGRSGARALAAPAAPMAASLMAPHVPAATAASPSGARAPAGPAAPTPATTASHMAPRISAAAAAGRRCARSLAGPATPAALTAVAPRIITRGAVLAPRDSAPARSRPVTAPAPPAHRPVTRAPARVPAVRLATATERNRKVQRKYLQRKQAREQATHASVGHLEERLAALLAQMEPLLARHEQLTRSLPWHQQQEEVEFMASIASSSSCRTEANPSIQQPPSPSRFIENIMLDPVTVDQICEAAGLHDFKQDKDTNHNASAAHLSACTAPGNAARCSSDPASLQSLVVALRLTKSQREAIGDGYERYVQAEAFLHEDCLALATKLQKLPTAKGALDSSSQHVLARHLIGSQLGGIIKHDRELTQRLTHTCFQGLNRYQMDLLRQLAPAGAPVDMPALCREITGGRLKRARPPPAANSIPATQPKKRAPS